MLPKSQKLNLKELQIKDLFRQGFRFKTDNFRVNFDFQTTKSGFSALVPKKNIPLATQRNLWKRFIYDELAKYLPSLADKKIRLVIGVTTKQKFSSVTKQTLQQELQKIVEKILKRNEKN